MPPPAAPPIRSGRSEEVLQKQFNPDYFPEIATEKVQDVPAVASQAQGSSDMEYAPEVVTAEAKWRQNVEEKFERIFQVNREMRDEILVYESILLKF